MRARRLLLVLSLCSWILPASASADWLVTPFIGLKFAGTTNFVDLDSAADDTKLTFGGSLGVGGEGMLGLEADFGYSPRFFERGDSSGLVARSNVTTLMGNVIVAAPLSVTRESLRPFILGGLGLIHVGIQDVADVFQVDRNLLGVTVGGGASGALTDEASLRIDLRYLTALGSGDPGTVGFGRTRLSFWRATVGVMLRY